MKKLTRFFGLGLIALLLSPSAPAAYFADQTLIERVLSTATAAGTTTLLYTSEKYQRFTGASNQTVKLPVATTMRKGVTFVVQNDSSGTLSVQYSDASAAGTVKAGRLGVFFLANNATAVGTWHVSLPIESGGVDLSSDTTTTALPTSKGGTGQDLSAATGVVKVAAGVGSASTIVNADVSASAAIARSKLAAGTASHVLINDGSGIPSSEATLAKVRGGMAQDNSSLTFPSSGTVPAYTPTNHGVVISGAGAAASVTAAGTSGHPLLSGGAGADPAFAQIADAGVSSSAAIARSKLASGTANHVVINDGSGVMSSEATLAKVRGGTAQDNSSLTFPSSGTIPAYTPANHGVVVSGAGAAASVSGAGTVGQCFASNGASADPTFQDCSTLSGVPDQSYEISNAAIATSVASSALTISLKGKNGSDPSGSNIVKIGFRNATAATGTYSQLTVTSALSVTISSGSTLGQTSAAAEHICVYALNNAGTVELAASTACRFDEGSVQSTTTEGGAGAADSRTVMYSTTGRSNVAVRLIGRITITEATAGTWASNATEISLRPFKLGAPITGSNQERAECTFNIDFHSGTPTEVHDDDNCVASSPDNGAAVGNTTITWTTGFFPRAPDCTFGAYDNGSARFCQDLTTAGPTTTGMLLYCHTDGGSNTDDCGCMVTCRAPR
jgi:hypothetical protein